MHKIVSTLAVAALATSLSSGIVMAEGTNTDVNAGVTTGTDNAGANAQVDAGAATDDMAGGATTSADASAMGADMSGVMSSLEAGTTMAASDISSMSADATIDIVLLSELESNAGDQSDALDTAISGQESTMTDIRTALEANSAIKAKLDEAGYTSDDVVAVTSTADNEITLVIDDSGQE